MRETRPYGSEGGVAGNGHPYPYDGIRPLACDTARVPWAWPTPTMAPACGRDDATPVAATGAARPRRRPALGLQEGEMRPA